MKILHITDVHVGWEADLGREKQAWERLYRETAAVAAGSGKADILAVTGDLVTNGTEEEYRRVENYLQGLGEILDIEKGQETRTSTYPAIKSQIQILVKKMERLWDQFM